MPLTPNQNQWLARFALPLLLAVALGLTQTGCGGGSSSVTAKAPTVNQPASSKGVGRVALVVDFPARVAARGGSVLPAALERVSVSLHAVSAGVELPEPVQTQEALRSSEGGGRVTVKFEKVRVGRYVARITGFDASGNVLVQSAEPVGVQAGVTVSLPATLGIVHNDDGFQPASLSLKQGDRLLVRQAGNVPGEFSIEAAGAIRGNAHCLFGPAYLERTGAMACTMTAAGTFTLHSPDGHVATVTVTEDAAGLAQAKPSLGLRRAEGFVREGQPFEAHFTFDPAAFLDPDGGPASFPTGYSLRPGEGLPTKSGIGEKVTVTYDEPGAYLAELVNSQGEVVAQRFVGVYERPEEQTLPPVVTLGALPQMVSQGFVLVSGSAPAGTSVVVQNGEHSQQAVVGPEGQFSTIVELEAGPNNITAYALDAEGITGPAVSAVVSFSPPPTLGPLAQIVLINPPTQVTAGESFTVVYEGRDENGQPVAFEGAVSVEGVTVTQQGPNTFTALTTGLATITVSGPGAPTPVLATSQMNVSPGPLATLRATPGNVTVRVGQTVALSVMAKDALGNEIPDVPLTYELVGPLDGLDPLTGSFTPMQPGYGAVRISSGGVSANLCVSVNPPPSQTPSGGI